jgi:Kdo2-lipid IVA lauroyltransferase/acyltransferase
MPRSTKFSKRLVAWISRGLMRLFERWMRGKSAVQAEKIGARFGRALFRLSRKHRERALSNLELAFPEMSHEDRRSLAGRVFEHFGMVATDFMRTTARTDEEVAASMEVEGAENVLQELEKGKGVLIVTAHFGNWERAAQYARVTGHDIHAVARNADDAQVQEDVMRLRESTGMKVISRGNAVRQILALLRANELVALLPDQNSSESFIPFFGHPTGTVLGPATLSRRTGAPLVPMFCARIGPGKYKLHLFPALKPKPGVEDEVLALSHSVNEIIERVIRMYPEQWLWFHDRWKSARKRGLL